jgi:hypothetical protein
MFHEFDIDVLPLCPALLDMNYFANSWNGTA